MARRIILLTGLPLFAKKISDDLSDFDPNNRYIFLNTYYSKLDKLKFICFLPFSYLVISFNGVTSRSRSLDLVLFFRKKLIMQWMGTDALLAIKRQKSGSIFRKYLDYSINFVDSEWQQEEVKSLGVNIKIVPFKYGREIEAIDKYLSLHILTYVAESRKEFYGWESIKLAAKKFPEIRFKVVGMKTDEFTYPENIDLLGWLDSSEMESALRNAPIYLRMTEHDGFSVTVIEALSVGAEVIWTHPSECVHFVKNDIEMIQRIEHSIKVLKSRNFYPNKENIEFCKNKYNRHKLIMNYLEVIKKIDLK